MVGLVFMVCKDSKLLHRLEHAIDEYGIDNYKEKCTPYIEIAIKPLIEIDEKTLFKIEQAITKTLEEMVIM